MSAALPPGELMAQEAQSGNPIVYQGKMGSDNVFFYFNLENNLFLCLATMGGCEAKMTGNMTQNEEGVYKCAPVWGVNPDNNEAGWVDTSFEETKTFDLKGNPEKVNFEGCELTRI